MRSTELVQNVGFVINGSTARATLGGSAERVEETSDSGVLFTVSVIIDVKLSGEWEAKWEYEAITPALRRRYDVDEKATVEWTARATGRDRTSTFFIFISEELWEHCSRWNKISDHGWPSTTIPYKNSSNKMFSSRRLQIASRRSEGRTRVEQVKMRHAYSPTNYHQSWIKLQQCRLAVWPVRKHDQLSLTLAILY